MALYLIAFNDEWVPDLTMEEIRERGVAGRAVIDEMTADGVFVFSDGAGPNKAMTPLDQPPYVAARFVLSDLGTKGGLVTDAAARVLRADGTAIPGLYAVGNTSASLTGPVYPAPGVPLGTAMVFASLAARDLAGT